MVVTPCTNILWFLILRLQILPLNSVHSSWYYYTVCFCDDDDDHHHDDHDDDHDDDILNNFEVHFNLLPWFITTPGPSVGNFMVQLSLDLLCGTVQWNYCHGHGICCPSGHYSEKSLLRNRMNRTNIWASTLYLECIWDLEFRTASHFQRPNAGSQVPAPRAI